MQGNLTSRVLSCQLSKKLLECLVSKQSIERVVSSGTRVLRTGQPLEYLPYIEGGRLDVVIHLDSQGSQLVPVSFEKGELALLSTLFCSDASNVDLLAVGPCRIIWLLKADLENALVSDASLLVLLVRFLGERMREVRKRERTWLTRNVEGRARAILARSVSESVIHGDSRIVMCTHEQLARRCGVSRSKLSTVLKQLETAEILRLHRGYIEVLDPNALLSTSAITR